ncbi:MAG: M16 family metallopeptidase, partial [bacterium]
LAVAPPPVLHAASPVTKTVLPSGLTVLVKEAPGADLVAVEVLTRAGPRVEDAAEAGIGFFTLGAMLRGTERRTAVEIASTLEGVGAVLSGSGSFDYSRLSVMTLTRHVDVAMDVLSDLVTAAKFDPTEVETLRRINVSRVRAAADQPLTRVQDLVAAHLYALHPYGNPVLGTVESLTALTRDRVVAFYRTFYAAPNMIVVVAGNVKADAVLDKVRRVFGQVRTDAVPQRVRLLPAIERALAPRSSERQEIRETQRTSAAGVAVGYMGVEVGHRDWAALRVINAIVGEGLSGRLFVEIREKQGLVYTIGGVFPTRAGPSTLTFVAGTDPPNVARVVDGILREVARLQEGLVPAEDLERGKQRVIGVHAIGHEDLRSQAFNLGLYELLGVGYAFDARLPEVVAAVRAEEVQRVARLYLQHPLIAVVAPPR